MRIITLAMFVLGLAGTALAQPTGSAGSAAPPAGSASPEAGPVATDPLPSVPTAGKPMIEGSSPAELRKLCTDAMNANPTLAQDVVAAADRGAQTVRDAGIIQAHLEAQDRVAKNQRHVIMAYIAMWLVAAGFVLFVWRRQQALKTEIESLRRELASKDAP